uniref:Uncharacterized protein n=1 Tax=Lactuca sativa TaxID=4236 RepID=A0A9R1VH79_LACSA|nr:hypothetical protein LSAT_V11C500252470 [Lactuca sativa]
MRLMDIQISTASHHYMDQEFAKLDGFDGQNYTCWVDKVKFMLHVLKLAYVLDLKLAPITIYPILEVGKTMDPTIISNLEKERALRRESEELYLYDLYASVKDPREQWSALEVKYKDHEEGTKKVPSVKLPRVSNG